MTDLRREELQLVAHALRKEPGAAGEEVALVGRYHQRAALPVFADFVDGEKA